MAEILLLFLCIDNLDFLVMQDKYKVYNLCSERLYDASLFEGKVSYVLYLEFNCFIIETRYLNYWILDIVM